MREILSSRALTLAFCSFALAGLAASQTTNQAGQDDKAKPAIIEGKVVNQVTGGPLKKTVLSLRPTGGALESNERGTAVSIETGDDGSFRFSNVAPGPYWFTAERAGFAPQYFNGHRSDTRGSVIKVHAGEQINGLVFKLTPNAIISGKVLDADGDPMRANVVVYRYAYRTSGKTIQSFANGATGAMGEYSISVPPGNYLLVASPPQNVLPAPATPPAAPGTAPPEGPVAIYAPVFYPNSIEQAGAIEIPAGAGADVRDIDFHMTKVKAYRVRGHASGGDGLFQLVPQAGPSPTSPPQFGRGGQDGRFEIAAVLPGTYYVMMNSQRGALIANQLLTVTDAHLDDVVLQFSPMPELKGTVTMEGDAKASVAGMQVGFDSLDNGTNPSGVVDKDGKFTISRILPGRYHPWAGLGGGGRYVKAIRYQDHDIKDTGLDLTEGISGTVEVIMSANAADVSGTVVDDDGKPCAGVSVVLIPASGAYLAYNSVTTDAQGHFDMSYVRPGDYTVYALEGILYLAWFDQEYMKPYSAKGAALTVQEKEKKTLSLKVVPVSPE